MVNVTFGLTSLIILLGIIFYGNLAITPQGETDFQTVQGYDLNKLGEHLDSNISASLSSSLADTNLSPTLKEGVVFLGRSFVYGAMFDLYLGKWINEVCPGAYAWIIENIGLVCVMILLIMNPGVLTVLFFGIFLLLMVLYERFFPSKVKKVSWRD